MFALEKGYKQVQGEGLYKLEYPTCEKYEPRFEAVFDFVQTGHMNDRKEVVSPDGYIVAKLWVNQQIDDLEKWIPGISSDITHLPMLVKNPYIQPEQQELIGKRNGLVCTA